jgi:L-threonylcarbamoyladenylate synthase
MARFRKLAGNGTLPLYARMRHTILTVSKPIAANAQTIAQAAHILADGGLVAFPTETVYGLGADATNGEAVAAIFAAKGRPRFNPLIVHVEDLKQAEKHGEFSEAARALARAFWPGALTLVLPRRADSNLSHLVSAGLDTVALRAPSHPIARDLLAASRRPIAAPSANLSGKVSATTAGHVVEGLSGKVDFILDGGPSLLGLESTVIGFDGEKPILLRPGAIARQDIEAITGPLAGAGEIIRAPGQLESHYAPRAALRLNVQHLRDGEVLLGFGDAPDARLNLSPHGDLKEAAANLFAMLRALDNAGEAIAVSPIPQTGLGEAINDRLMRAAAPRGTS